MGEWMSERTLGAGPLSAPESDELDEAVLPMVVAPRRIWIDRTRPSYMPTGVALLDRLLARADELTDGWAGLLQRVVSYLMVGGFAACVNLAVFYVLLDLTPMPLVRNAHVVVAYLIAAEVSIMANFIPNDRITFSRLPGHARSWWMRCARFHSTCIMGTLITFIVSFTLLTRLHAHTLIAESTGIIIALVFNFTFHHIWTYRHVGAVH
jgi:putative flippase GtrA